MVTVGVRELKQQTSELIRQVRDKGDEIRVTHHGKVVARIVPVAPSAEETEFLAPALLLAETAGAISRRTGDARLAAQAVEHLERLPGLRLVEMDRALLNEAARLAAELGLRGADSTYVAAASRLNIPLATLDADQRERTARRVAIIALPLS